MTKEKASEFDPDILIPLILKKIQQDKWDKLVKNKQDIYEYVDDLIKKTQDLLDSEAINMPEKSVEAANAMIKDLTLLRNSTSPDIPIDFEQFLKQSFAIVYKYESKLDAAPGFFNQMKSLFNGFIEKLTGIKDVFSVDKTIIGQHSEVQTAKEKIKSMNQNEFGTVKDRVQRFFSGPVSGMGPPSSEPNDEDEHTSSNSKLP